MCRVKTSQHLRPWRLFCIGCCGSCSCGSRSAGNGHFGCDAGGGDRGDGGTEARRLVLLWYLCNSCNIFIHFCYGVPGHPNLTRNSSIYYIVYQCLSLFLGFTIENGYPTYCSSINWGFLSSRLTWIILGYYLQMFLFVVLQILPNEMM